MLMPTKRPSRPSAKDAKTKSHHPSHGGGAPLRRGRPMKRASELKPSSRTRALQAKRLHAQVIAASSRSSSGSDGHEDQPRNLSGLESLPAELIQQIFFFSFEVNMPRASPYLARVLSKPSIYRALVLFAYFLDDLTVPVEVHHFLPAEYRWISVEDQIRLQQGILGCQWCTLDLLKSCMPALSRLRMFQEWHHERQYELANNLVLTRDMVWRGGPAEENEEEAQATETIIATLPSSLDDRLALERHYEPKLEPPFNGDGGDATISRLAGPSRRRGRLYRGRQPVVGPVGDAGTLPCILSWIWYQNRQEVSLPFKTRQMAPPLSSFMSRVLPDRLLRGSPWTEEKLTLVQLLRQGHRFLPSRRAEGLYRVTESPPWSTSLDFHATDFCQAAPDPTVRVPFISAAALFDGMASAILEGNEKALLVLLELHYATANMEVPREMAPIVPVPDRNATTLVGPYTHALPLKLFHLACEYGRQLESDQDSPRPSDADGERSPQVETTRPKPTSAGRMLSLLVREGIDSVPLNDPVLTRWAIHVREMAETRRTTEASSTAVAPLPLPLDHDVALARWLLRYMAGEIHSARNGQLHFTNGRMHDFSLWARDSPFPDITFTSEIGYLTW